MVKPGKAIRKTVASVDWGYTNPGVIQAWGLDGDDRMYLLHEFYRTGRQIDWWVERAKEIDAMYRPYIFTCDPSEPAFIDRFRQSGLHTIGAENDVLIGIQTVQMRLRKQGDGKPRLFVSREACPDRDRVLLEKKKPTCTAEEIAMYVWATSRNGTLPKEEPVKENDHGLDALRYAVAELDGLGTYSASAF